MRKVRKERQKSREKGEEIRKRREKVEKDRGGKGEIRVRIETQWTETEGERLA